MKKIFTLAALACAAISMNAEVFNYDFNLAPSFFPILQAPVEEFGKGQQGNYDMIDKTGTPKVDGSKGDLLQMKDADGNWVATEPRCRVSLGDGYVYYQDATDGLFKDGDGIILDESEPFVCYGDKGPSRVIWMYGWDSTAGYTDKDYGAASEENWVSTKHGIQFGRNANSGVRQDTYIQFPAGEGNATLTVYASHAGSKYTTALDVKVVPVIDGVEQEPFYFNKPLEEATLKRYYKFTRTYNNNGGKLAFKVGCNGSELNLHHVTIETGVEPEAGLENIIANSVADENAPIYNVLGVQVDENYKGIVIKNGKKYIQQ